MTWNEEQHSRATDGRFTETAGTPPESPLALNTEDGAPDEIDLGPFRVDTSWLEDYPDWPQTLPERRIDWGYDDDHGLTTAEVTVGRAWSVHAWRDLYGDLQTDLTDGGNPDWTAAEVEAIEDTLRVAQARSDAIVGEIEWSATHAPGMEESIRRAVEGSAGATNTAPEAILSETRRAQIRDLLAAIDTTEPAETASRRRFADRAEAILRDLLESC